ncbi:MAG: DegT/DnrJ/EryC1/StrS family aminotransferase [Candidatus Colwellbacteria bacterium]|nr:DegT/DnrJ/EryC1/StrS family aminotransferase [Candidatus Colwellbacteria bacterium]
MFKNLAIRGGKPIVSNPIRRPSPIGKDEIAAGVRVLRSGVLSRAGRGREVLKFEVNFAKYCDVQYAVTTTSGTTALHTALEAIGVCRGDEVIVPALTFVSSASVILQQNARPVFADVDPDTFCLDVSDFKKKITPKTKAVIVVHLYGNPANMRDIIRIAKKHEISVVEDCAQAHGAIYNRHRVGTLGDIGCFSFYQTKNMTCGEGGMVITNKKKLYEACKSIVDHGLIDGYLQGYNYNRLGHNYHMTELQAAIGLAQLKKLNRLNNQRRRNAVLYKKLLSDTPLRFQRETHLGSSVYYGLTALLPEKFISKRDWFIEAVRAENVEINNLYPHALSRTELFRKYNSVKLPVAENVSARLFNCYTNPGITKYYIHATSRAIKKVLSNL